MNGFIEIASNAVREKSLSGFNQPPTEIPDFISIITFLAHLQVLTKQGQDSYIQTGPLGPIPFSMLLVRVTDLDTILLVLHLHGSRSHRAPSLRIRLSN